MIDDETGRRCSTHGLDANINSYEVLLMGNIRRRRRRRRNHMGNV
jgi:hypothetical protein